ncbi:kinesin-domain-containing protein [Coprinopsis marcescibilis]|uniref:Kinesin-like protein n=1 Tax=Coprinopsis marcescibilis TaxID=230819 RepID=A0A5C3KU04_COPMA|nr:kinesin-domain-containing protein [Coprinopsis marcescibilis]
MAASGTHKVKIAARLRPRLDGEIVDENIKVVHGADSSAGGAGSTISVTNPRDLSQVFKFPFSSCYDENSTQEEIFRNDVEPLIDVVYSGVTVTIFAYGVTSSGKTHTMQGTRAEPGVIPRVLRTMFEKKPRTSPTGGVYRTELAVSYMEIYKDEVYDLLVARESAPKLPVRENDVGMVFVANLSSVVVKSVEEFDQIYSQATRNRSTGATNLNRASSRSHAVLTVEARMVDDVANTTLTGKINLVDLAGSENNKQTGNDSTRMAESAAINKSLSVLGQVVHALNLGAPRIPYRNSKLTRILQDALGGQSVGLLICNLAPGVRFRQDTLNTLNFAVRTKNVENKPVVNERDNRPQPKPHFSAQSVGQGPGKSAVGLQAVQAAAAGVGGGVVMKSRVSLAPAGRMSLAPGTRVPRASFGGVGSGNHYQSFVVPGGRRLTALHEAAAAPSGSGVTAEDLDARISKAVEAAVEVEVARRLKEREKEWQEEQRRLEGVIQEKTEEAKMNMMKERDRERERSMEMRERDMDRREAERSREDERSREMSLPSGVLTPLLKKHRDLDVELKERLVELERKFEKGNKETQLADVLSPVSKKKTGRAYVALARAHSEKGDLSVALDLYRKAETYVPDNIKLKERIIEIEWAVKNERPYVPSPKPVKKQRQRREKSKMRSGGGEEENAHDDALGGMDVEHEGGKEAAAAGHGYTNSSEFGVELTNEGGLNSSVSKRTYDDCLESDRVGLETPVKKQRIGGEEVGM